MKKIDILQTTILVIAVMSAYSVMENILSTVSAFAQAFVPYSPGFGAAITQLIITIAVAIVVYLLIRYSRWIAGWLLKNDPDGDTEDTARWNVDRRTLIFALIIGIGLYTVIFALAYAINDFIDFFNLKVAANSGISVPNRRNYLILELLRLTIGAFLIYGAPNLTDFIEKTIAVRLKRHTDTQSN